MVLNIVSLPVTILFIIVGCGLLYYAIQLKKKFSEEHNFFNSVITFLLWIIAGLAYPFFFTSNNSNLRFFQTLSVLLICIFTPGIIVFILYYQYQYVVKSDPDIKSRRNLATFFKNYNNRSELSDQKRTDIITDLHRKVLHLFPAGAIVLLWIFANYIWDGLWNADDLWGISGVEFGKFLILTSGYSGILVFAGLDYVRLSFIFENRNLYHLLPDNVLDILGKTMKRNEIYEYTRPVIIVLSFVPIFFLPFGIFCAAILTATIGDGAASIFGLRFGKRHFPKSSKKNSDWLCCRLCGFFWSKYICFMVV